MLEASINLIKKWYVFSQNLYSLTTHVYSC